MDVIKLQHPAWQRPLLLLAALVATLMVVTSTLVLVRSHSGSSGAPAIAPTVQSQTGAAVSPPRPRVNRLIQINSDPGDAVTGSAARPSVRQ